MDRRRIYCKWKASQILKALKEGKIPTPGGAGEDVVTGMPSSNDAAAPAPAPEATGMPSSSGGGGGGGGYGGGTDESKYDPSTRPRTPVPSAAGPRRSGSGGGRAMEGNMADAMEHCKFALRALEKKDVDLAVQKLHEALQQLT
ncbi:conserved unknown protein [Ectocarpus siliculosus]|uniref:Vta1 C-terminal domain-containing protein n=1 Tax=Ectocarpus siliculosus TaxID=2880 RepID=D8LGK2_ECTSI|nr:conserved unknown protein [Ectocarpus siliculosus]|eukprot:CBN79059.1 conserved unknown protein [Ectocarpus siliculosus]